MLSLDKRSHKITVILIAVSFCLHLFFPQYAFAQTINEDELAKQLSILNIDNSPQLIIYDDIEPLNNLPRAADSRPLMELKVEITAYSSTIEQCDGDPFTTASGTRVKEGIIAANFLPFGTKIKIPSLYGDQVFVVQDRMNRRFSRRVDIWMASTDQARHFGIKYLAIEIYK